MLENLTAASSVKLNYLTGYSGTGCRPLGNKYGSVFSKVCNEPCAPYAFSELNYYCAFANKLLGLIQQQREELS